MHACGEKQAHYTVVTCAARLKQRKQLCKPSPLPPAPAHRGRRPRIGATEKRQHDEGMLSLFLVVAGVAVARGTQFLPARSCAETVIRGQA